MSSTDFGVGLLVGSSGLLGPIWEQTLRANSSRLMTADLAADDCDFALDLTDKESIHRLISQLPDLDFVVINAGRDSKLSASEKGSNQEQFDFELWKSFFEVNVIGPAALIEALSPKLNYGSTVVAIGSMYGLIAPRIDVYNEDTTHPLFFKHPAYGASKAALVNLMRQYATRFAGKVSFNLLTLGVVANNQPDVFAQKMPRNIPTGTFLDRDNLGKHLDHLIRARDLQFTGQNVVIDGGYTSW